MTRSSLTAALRVYDSGQEYVAVYYLGLLGDEFFVDVWRRSDVGELVVRFAEENGFDAYTLSVVRVGSGTTETRG